MNCLKKWKKNINFHIQKKVNYINKKKNQKYIHIVLK